MNKIFLLWVKCKSDVKETNVKEQKSVLPPIGRAETMEGVPEDKMKNLFMGKMKDAKI